MEKRPEFKPVRNGSRLIFLARLSFVHLDKPWAGSQGNTPKYQLSAIVPKDDTATIEALKAAIKEAYTAGVAKVWGGKEPNTKSSSWKRTLKDGDDERPNDETYRDSIFLSCTSKNQVATLNRLKEVIPPEEVYSGCWGLVSCNFFAYSQGSNGVACGLNAVLKYADGEKLSGGGGDGRNDFDGLQLPSDVALDDF